MVINTPVLPIPALKEEKKKNIRQCTYSAVKKKKAYLNKAKPQKTKEFVNIPIVDPFH